MYLDPQDQIITKDGMLTSKASVDQVDAATTSHSLKSELEVELQKNADIVLNYLGTSLVIRR